MMMRMRKPVMRVLAVAFVLFGHQVSEFGFSSGNNINLNEERTQQLKNKRFFDSFGKRNGVEQERLKKMVAHQIKEYKDEKEEQSN